MGQTLWNSLLSLGTLLFSNLVSERVFSLVSYTCGQLRPLGDCYSHHTVWLRSPPLCSPSSAILASHHTIQGCPLGRLSRWLSLSEPTVVASVATLKFWHCDHQDQWVHAPTSPPSGPHKRGLSFLIKGWIDEELLVLETTFVSFKECKIIKKPCFYLETDQYIVLLGR